MNNLIFISLNCLYFFFGVILINTIRKEFFTQTKKDILKINADKIFIPENKDKISHYMVQLSKSPIKPKYVFMLPGSQMLTNKSELWSFLRGKYYNNITYLYNFFLKSYVLDNYLDRQLLEAQIYRKNQKFPITFILSKLDEKIKLLHIQNHFEFFDLISKYREGGYKIIQELNPNIFIYKNKFLTLETYILLIKRNGKLEMYYYDYYKYLLFDINKGNYVRTYNVEVLLQNEFFKKQYQTIIKCHQKNLQFLYQNIKEHILLDKILEDTCQFEILSVNFFLDQKFKLYFFDINKSINLLGDMEKEIYTKLIFETYGLVRDEIKVNNTNYLLVS